MTTETLESLRHERDNLRAEIVALREALKQDAKFLHAMWDSSQAKTGCEAHLETVRDALSHPNPGQPLLDRLAAAEGVIGATLAFERSFLRRFPTTDDEPTCQAYWDAVRAALAAWRKLTEEAK